jgi:hypothetical protein
LRRDEGNKGLRYGERREAVYERDMESKRANGRMRR